jgi:hypothetical protein
MKIKGVDQQNIKRIMGKTYQHLDLVLDALIGQDKLAIVNVSSKAPPGYKCPVCGASSAAPK